MSQREKFVLSTGSGRELHGVVDLPERPGRRPAVVVCHGFKGFMEWGFFPPLAELLAGRGYAVVRFNFSGSGMRPGDELVTDVAAFRAATFSRDVEEVLEVLGAVGHDVAADRADPERLALLGHSRGGGAAVLAAAERADLKALVTWAAVSRFDRQPEEAKAAWRAQGLLEVVNARTGQELEIGVEVLDDLEARREELDVQAAAERVTAPWLIVHGADDESVSVEDARRLDGRATADRELLIVPGGSHTFGAVHPFQGPTPELIRVFNATQTWLRRHLG